MSRGLVYRLSDPQVRAAPADVRHRRIDLSAGDRLNVGHLYEWAWLFSRAVEEGAPNGSKYIAMGNRMIDLGNKVGYNQPAGGSWSGADVNGNVPNKQMIWWCQAELLRATAHYAIRHGRSDLWPYFDQSLAFLRANFLDAEYGGWYYAWIPHIPRDQMPRTGGAKRRPFVVAGRSG
jgi:mannose/cellobiose epimerase-like protein (N-acyl-D-glucosamine 2-epimerase family)